MILVSDISVPPPPSMQPIAELYVVNELQRLRRTLYAHACSASSTRAASLRRGRSCDDDGRVKESDFADVVYSSQFYTISICAPLVPPLLANALPPPRPLSSASPMPSIPLSPSLSSSLSVPKL